MIDEVAAWIAAEDFYSSAHGEVWSAILAIRGRGLAVDAVTLADHLIAIGRFVALGGDDFVTGLVDSVPSAANARYYAGIVREQSVARQILDAATETIRELYSGKFTAPDLMERVEERIFGIADRSVVGETIDAATLIGETYARLKMLSDRRSVGLSAGYGDLDAVIGGMAPGQFIVLAARPSEGKTALALNIATNVASEGQVVYFASLEMARVELGNRLFSSFGGVDGDSLLRPWYFGPADWQKILGACQEISKFPLFIDDTPVRTVSQIAANARRIKRRSPAGLGLVVIDYLGLISGPRLKGESRQEEVARISRRIKQMGRDLRVPVICLHQLNRGVENRDDGRPRLADLRESGQIEQDADVALLLHRPRGDGDNGRTDVIVAKNRNGRTGTVPLVFVRHLARFDSISDERRVADGPAF